MRNRIFTSRSAGLVVLAAFGAFVVGLVAPISHARSDEGSDVYSSTGLLAQRILKDEPEKEGEEEEKEEEKAEEAVEIVKEPSALKQTSPALAFLFSAGVPGTGQFYNGNRRGFAYLAVEAVAWIAHFSFRSSGNKKEDEFKDFADGHWDLERFRDSIGDPDSIGCTGTDEDLDQIIDFSKNNRDHYYEDIGKLEAYACGWDTQVNRQEYKDLRSESNDLKSWSRRALMLAFLNHLVSAFDAFRTARSRELSIAPDTELKMDIGGKWNKPRATLKLVHHW